jgi:hypothetical protein
VRESVDRKVITFQNRNPRKGDQVSRFKRTTRILGSLALLLYATTLVASTAGAGAASWKVSGKEVTAELSPAVAIKEIEGNKATLLTSVSGIKVEFVCTTLQPINVKLKPEGVIAFESQLKYTGCITKLNGTTSGPCEPVSESKETGVIKTSLLKGQLVPLESSGVVRFEPTIGETLATIEMSAECPISTKIPIIGNMVLKDSALGTAAETHLATESPATELWAVSKTTEHKLTFDGSMVFRLGGTHAGFPWNGDVPVQLKETTWLVKGTAIGTELSPLVAAKELEGNDATLLTKIAGVKVEVLCTATQLSGIKLQSKGTLSSESQVNFSGCLTKLNEKENGACEPNNKGIEPGAISSQLLKGTLIYHEGSGLVRLEPASGETLATIETSAGCSLGTKIPLLGKVTLKDSSLATEAETHLVVAGPLTELWAVSKTEEHKVTLDGSAVVRLASSHAGLSWSGFVVAPAPTIGWRVKGADVTAALTPAITVKEIEGNDATLLTKIIGIKVEFLCTTLQAISAKLEPKGVVSFGSQLKFAGCTTKLNGATSGACEPLSEGKEPGVIKTKLLKGLLVLHEGSGIVRFEATEGETLATLEFGAECSIASKVPILGKLTLKDASIGTEAITHLAIAGPLTEIWAISKTEEHKITIDGSIVTALAGVHAGIVWSGVPE